MYICFKNVFYYFYSILRNCLGMDKVWNFFWREVEVDRENFCFLRLVFCLLLKKFCVVVWKDYLIYLKLFKMWYFYILLCIFIWKYLFLKILSYIYRYIYKIDRINLKCVVNVFWFITYFFFRVCWRCVYRFNRY